MLPVFLILLICIILLAPYAILLVRRHKTVKEIKEVALGCGFKVKPLHKLVFFSRNRGKKYDYMLAGKHRIYAVKLWSATRADSTLVVCGKSSYYVSGRVSEPFEQRDRGEYNLHSRRLKAPEIKHSVKARQDREIIEIMLVCPAYKRVIQRRGNDILVYEQGDRIFGKRMYYPDGFKSLLFDDANASSLAVENVGDSRRSVKKVK